MLVCACVYIVSVTCDLQVEATAVFTLFEPTFNLKFLSFKVFKRIYFLKNFWSCLILDYLNFLKQFRASPWIIDAQETFLPVLFLPVEMNECIY